YPRARASAPPIRGLARDRRAQRDHGGRQRSAGRAGHAHESGDERRRQARAGAAEPGRRVGLHASRRKGRHRHRRNHGPEAATGDREGIAGQRAAGKQRTAIARQGSGRHQRQEPEAAGMKDAQIADLQNKLAQMQKGAGAAAATSVATAAPAGSASSPIAAAGTAAAPASNAAASPASSATPSAAGSAPSAVVAPTTPASNPATAKPG